MTTCLKSLLISAFLCTAGAPAAPPADDFFTLVVMPDTQYYTEVQWKADQYFKGQTQWIVDHRASDHIAFVSHVGDLQQDGTFLRTDAHQADEEAHKLMATTRPGDPPLHNSIQWQRADAAMRILDNADIPYVAVAGNHDYLHWDRKTLPDDYVRLFGPSRFAGKSWYGGASPASPKSPAGMNSYQYFSAAGQKFLSIGLQFAPDQWDLDWAQKVIDANPNLPTIITTHGYLTTKGYDKDRRNIWEQLVRKNPQIFMTINGHVNGHNLIIERDDAGLDVIQILVDYQDLPVKGYAHGGAYMRLMRFYPDRNLIDVRTFSPVTKSYLTNPKDDFLIQCNLQSRFHAQLHPTPPTTQLSRPTPIAATK